ncbi:MAG: hypothetical protein ACMXX9_01965 [Candidatus Woesearchaeota archaeon]
MEIDFNNKKSILVSLYLVLLVLTLPAQISAQPMEAAFIFLDMEPKDIRIFTSDHPEGLVYTADDITYTFTNDRGEISHVILVQADTINNFELVNPDQIKKEDFDNQGWGHFVYKVNNKGPNANMRDMQNLWYKNAEDEAPFHTPAGFIAGRHASTHGLDCVDDDFYKGPIDPHSCDRTSDPMLCNNARRGFFGDIIKYNKFSVTFYNYNVDLSPTNTIHGTYCVNGSIVPDARVGTGDGISLGGSESNLDISLRATFRYTTWHSSCDVQLRSSGNTLFNESKIINFDAFFTRIVPDGFYLFTYDCLDNHLQRSPRGSSSIRVNTDNRLFNFTPRRDVYRQHDEITISMQSLMNATCYYTLDQAYIPPNQTSLYTPRMQQDPFFTDYLVHADRGWVEYDITNGTQHSATLTGLEEGAYRVHNVCMYAGSYLFGSGGQIQTFAVDESPPRISVLNMRNNNSAYTGNETVNNELRLSLRCEDEPTNPRQSLIPGDRPLVFGCGQTNYSIMGQTQGTFDRVELITVLPPEKPEDLPLYLNISTMDRGGNKDNFSIPLLVRNTTFTLPQISLCDEKTSCPNILLNMCRPDRETGDINCDVNLRDQREIRTQVLTINYSTANITPSVEMFYSNTNTSIPLNNISQNNLTSDYVYQTNMLPNGLYNIVINATNNWDVNQVINLRFIIRAPAPDIGVVTPKHSRVDNQDFVMSTSNTLEELTINTSIQATCGFTTVQPSNNIIDSYDNIFTERRFNTTNNLNHTLNNISLPTLFGTLEEDIFRPVYIICKPLVDEGVQLSANEYGYKLLSLGRVTGSPQINLSSNPNPVRYINERVSIIQGLTNQRSICDIELIEGKPINIDSVFRNDFNRQNISNADQFFTRNLRTNIYINSLLNIFDEYVFNVTCTNLADVSSSEILIVDVNLTNESLPTIISPFDNQIFSSLPIRINVTTQIPDLCTYNLGGQELDLIPINRTQQGSTQHTAIITGIEDGNYTLTVNCQRSSSSPSVEFLYDSSLFIMTLIEPIINFQSQEIAYGNSDNFRLAIQADKEFHECKFGVGVVTSQAQEDLKNIFETANLTSFSKNGLVMYDNSFSVRDLYDDYLGDGSDNPLFKEIDVICFERDKYQFQRFWVGSDRTQPIFEKIYDDKSLIETQNLTSPLRINIETDDLSICKVEGINLDSYDYTSTNQTYTKNNLLVINSDQDLSHLNSKFLEINVSCENLAGHKNNTVHKIPINLGIIIRITNPQHQLIENPNFAVSNSPQLNMQIKTDVEDVLCGLINNEIDFNDLNKTYNDILNDFRFSPINSSDHEIQLNLPDQQFTDGNLQNWNIFCIDQNNESTFGFKPILLGYITTPPNISLVSNPNPILRVRHPISQMILNSNQDVICQELELSLEDNRQVNFDQSSFNPQTNSYQGFKKQMSSRARFINTSVNEPETYDIKTVCYNLASLNQTHNVIVNVSLTNQQIINIIQPANVVYAFGQIPVNITTLLPATCKLKITNQDSNVSTTLMLQNINKLTHYSNSLSLNNEALYSLDFDCKNEDDQIRFNKDVTIEVREFGPPAITVISPQNNRVRSSNFGFSDNSSFNLVLESRDEGICRYIINTDHVILNPQDQNQLEDRYNAWTANQFSFSETQLTQTLSINMLNNTRISGGTYNLSGGGERNEVFRNMHVICSDDDQYRYTRIYLGADITPPNIEIELSDEIVKNSQDASSEIRIISDDFALCTISQTSGPNISSITKYHDGYEFKNVYDFSRTFDSIIRFAQDNSDHEFDVTCENAAGRTTTETITIRTEFVEQQINIIKPTPNQYVFSDQLDIEVNTILRDKCEYSYARIDTPTVQWSNFRVLQTIRPNNFNHTTTISGLSSGSYELRVRCGISGFDEEIQRFVVDTSPFSVRVHSPRPPLSQEPYPFAYSDKKEFDLSIRVGPINVTNNCAYGFNNNLNTQSSNEQLQQAFNSFTEFNTFNPQQSILTANNFDLTSIYPTYGFSGQEYDFLPIQIICRELENQTKFYFGEIKVGADTTPPNINITSSISEYTNRNGIQQTIYVETDDRTTCNLEADFEGLTIISQQPYNIVDGFRQNHEFEINYQGSLDEIENITFTATCKNRARLEAVNQSSFQKNILPQKITLSSPIGRIRTQNVNIYATTRHPDTCTYNIEGNTSRTGNLQRLNSGKEHRTTVNNLPEGYYNITINCAQDNKSISNEFSVILGDVDIWVSSPVTGIEEKPLIAVSNQQEFDLTLTSSRPSECKYSFVPGFRNQLNSEGINQTFSSSNNLNDFDQSTQNTFTISNLDLQNHRTGYSYDGSYVEMHVVCKETGTEDYIYEQIMLASNIEELQITQTQLNPRTIIDPSNKISVLQIETNQKAICWATTTSNLDVQIQKSDKNQFNSSDNYSSINTNNIRILGNDDKATIPITIVCEDLTSRQKIVNETLKLEITRDSRPRIIKPQDVVGEQPVQIEVQTTIVDTCTFDLKTLATNEIALNQPLQRSQNGLTHTASRSLAEGNYEISVKCDWIGYDVTKEFEVSRVKPSNVTMTAHEYTCSLSSFEIELDATEVTSGINRYEYEFSIGNNKTEGQTTSSTLRIPLNEQHDGAQLDVSVRAVSNAGIRGDFTSRKFLISNSSIVQCDVIPPRALLQINPDPINSLYYNLTVDCVDNRACRESFRYSIHPNTSEECSFNDAKKLNTTIKLEKTAKFCYAVYDFNDNNDTKSQIFTIRPSSSTPSTDSCFNELGIQVVCGGDCPTCEIGRPCTSDDQCISGNCENGMCAAGCIDCMKETNTCQLNSDCEQGELCIGGSCRPEVEKEITDRTISQDPEEESSILSIILLFLSLILIIVGGGLIYYDDYLKKNKGSTSNNYFGAPSPNTNKQDQAQSFRSQIPELLNVKTHDTNQDIRREEDVKKKQSVDRLKKELAKMKIKKRAANRNKIFDEFDDSPLIKSSPKPIIKKTKITKKPQSKTSTTSKTTKQEEVKKTKLDNKKDNSDNLKTQADKDTKSKKPEPKNTNTKKPEEEESYLDKLRKIAENKDDD